MGGNCRDDMRLSARVRCVLCIHVFQMQADIAANDARCEAAIEFIFNP